MGTGAFYKLYLLDPSDRIIRAEWIEAEGDEQALDKAGALHVLHDRELWLENRKVARLLRQQTSSDDLS